VYVCSCRVLSRYLPDILRDAPAPHRDSKKHTEKKRDKRFQFLNTKRKEGVLDYTLSSAKAFEIDRAGIAVCISECVNDSLHRIVSEEIRNNTLVLLDGGLHAPPYFAQKTIIKGDEHEAVIAFASILAKVLRDRLLTQIHRTFPEYGFDEHKGYGTKKHIEAIQKHGPCEEHRLSFLKNIMHS